MGYSEFRFVRFMISKGGDEIDLWEFDELVDLVREFKTRNRPLTEAEKELEANGIFEEVPTPTSKKSSPSVQHRRSWNLFESSL